MKPELRSPYDLCQFWQHKALLTLIVRKEKMAAPKVQKHFVLVHGVYHRPWSWYKLKPRLGSVGHQVTALDLAASGINMKAIQDVHTILGGLNLALAMDKYPEKVAVGVFMVTFMTDTKHEFPDKDFELTETLARPGSLFLDDLSKAKNFSTEGYGSVLLVYVGCDQDLVITVEFQQWLIKNGEPEDLMEIKGADHMPMFSKPDELCHCLLEIAHRYA
nr:salicylic acid-binding protein 2 [Quercus suber]